MTLPLPKVLATATELPPHTKSTDEILSDMERHLAGQDERFRQKVLRIFRYSQVERRYSILPAKKVLGRLSFEERNDLYCDAMRDLGESVLRKALERANLPASSLDFIISVSCTGFMIPSVDAHLINRLGMRRDIVRLPVTEMGCAAGVSGLIYANSFLRAHPGTTAAIVALESPMSTFQVGDFSMANMVSAAIFGDGAACAILGFDEEKLAPALVDTDMYHFYDEIDLMGFRLRNSGLEMILDPDVPVRIGEEFERIVQPFLERNGLGIADVDHLIFHPGGKKIIQMVESLFAEWGKDLTETLSVLRDFGNLSSATVLYVLDRFLEKEIAPGDHGLMLSFGPGFSAQSALLRWQ
ncbi:MAG: type III polyketide synthase [Candidatus Eisenbacteria bacterium]|uniref:Type III polyketide synthase n=1 Tax=Eiseniibacteriota bacterium TaxID=2212470 RepID=A0A956SG39_UNCEI|nr:type III polyketide synthase [Candidatus Eisenbacteria bacterium]